MAVPKGDRAEASSGLGLLTFAWMGALVLYVGLAPVGVQLTFLGPQVGAQPLVFFAAITAAFLMLVLHRRALPLPLASVAILAYFGWSGATILWSVDRGVGLYLWTYRLHIIIPAAWFAVALMGQSRVRTGLVMGVYLGSCLAAAVLAFTGFGLVGAERLSLTEVYNPTWLGGFLALGIFVAVWQLQRVTSTLVQVALLLLVGVNVVGVVYTQSRNSMAALVAGAITAFFVRHLRVTLDRHSIGTVLVRAARAALLVGLGALGVMLAYMIVSERTGVGLSELDRLQRTISLTDPSTATGGRLEIWRRGFGFLTQPIWGVGYGSFPVLHEMVYGRYLQAHNLYLQVVVDTGLIGLILLFGVLFTAWRELWSSRASFLLFWVFLYLVLLGIGNDVMAYKHFWVGWLMLMVFLRVEQGGHDKVPEPAGD
jgi:O-antigen ligase